MREEEFLGCHFWEGESEDIDLDFCEFIVGCGAREGFFSGDDETTGCEKCWLDRFWYPEIYGAETRSLVVE